MSVRLTDNGLASSKGTEALNQALKIRMQTLAEKGLHSGVKQDEEDLEKLTPSEREELMTRLRKSLRRASSRSKANEHHPTFLDELDPADGHKLVDALELHGELAMLAIRCHPDTTRPGATVTQC